MTCGPVCQRCGAWLEPCLRWGWYLCGDCLLACMTCGLAHASSVTCAEYLERTGRPGVANVNGVSGARVEENG